MTLFGYPLSFGRTLKTTYPKCYLHGTQFLETHHGQDREPLTLQLIKSVVIIAPRRTLSGIKRDSNYFLTMESPIGEHKTVIPMPPRCHIDYTFPAVKVTRWNCRHSSLDTLGQSNRDEQIKKTSTFRPPHPSRQLISTRLTPISLVERLIPSGFLNRCMEMEL